MRLIGLLWGLAGCVVDQPLPNGSGGDRELDAADWCEAVTPALCAFEVRCGRESGDEAACVARRSAGCEADEEPVVAALVDQGQASLSEGSVAACVTALGAAVCEQPGDVVSAVCATALVGQVDAGGVCGPGLSAFVCEDRCVVGADGCGVCATAVPVGQPCSGGDVCAVGTVCRDDPATAIADPSCLAPQGGGDRCDDAYPCAPGLFCFAGACYGPDYRAIGEACDGVWDRCVGGASCRQGVCVATVALGAACDADAPCDAGACVLGACEPRREAGEFCASAAECLSGACQDDACVELPGACFL